MEGNVKRIALLLTILILIPVLADAQPPQVILQPGAKYAHGVWSYALFGGIEGRYLGMDWRGGGYYSPNLSDGSPDKGDDFEGLAGFLGRKVLNPLGGQFEWYVYPAAGGRIEVVDVGNVGSGLLKLEVGVKMIGVLGLGVGADWKVNNRDVFVYGSIDLTQSLLSR